VETVLKKYSVKTARTVCVCVNFQQLVIFHIYMKGLGQQWSYAAEYTANWFLYCNCICCQDAA